MGHSIPSALVVDKDRRVLLRIEGRFYDLSQAELRRLLGLPAGPPGLGITIDDGRLHFEFVADGRGIELSAKQLHRLLGKRITAKA